MSEEIRSTKNDSEDMSKTPPALSRGGSVFILLFGVLLPFVTLFIELTTRMCTNGIFDPVPTIAHILLVGFIPVSNLFVWLATVKNMTKYISTLGVVNGIAIGASLVYSIAFIPISPFAVIGIIFFGFGLLPLSPVLSFISAIICRRCLKRMALSVHNHNLSLMWCGIALGIGLLFIFEIPPTVTSHYVKMAASDATESRMRAIRMLRTINSEQTLLRMCYRRRNSKYPLEYIMGFIYQPGNNLRLSGWSPIHFSEARKIYYRVTGIPFNKVSPPVLPRGWGRSGFDEGLGGETVAEKIEGLSLKSSRIDGFMYSDAAIGYTEWMLVFSNSSEMQREARAQVLLPPGGVVSRLTLWVNGEEREAAFSAKGKVRQAYQQVVSRRRDPVLVTASGPDRVMVQCFPVPPGGEMKIRIGITSPMILEKKEQGLLFLPCFLEHNFSIPKNAIHSIWMESKNPISSANNNLKPENPQENLWAVRGMVSDSELSENRVKLQAVRSAEAVTAWTPDLMDNGRIIRQVIEEADIKRPSRILIVIDGSASMQEFIPAIAEALPSLPEDIEFGVIIASDMADEIMIPTQKGTTELYRKTGNQLRAHRYAGGCDNVQALARAWDIAFEKAGTAIVWIHGVQPVLLQSTDVIQQRLDRRPGSVRLFDIQVANGPNRIIEKLGITQDIEPVPFLSGTGLKKLFGSWTGKMKQIRFSRKKISQDDFPGISEKEKTSSHLARLWAYNKILKLGSPGSDIEISQAMNLAVSYQLVTPISGAVVLETEQQYKEAGLKPADPDTVPKVPTASASGSGVPEPSTILLMAAGLLVWIFLQRRRKIAS
ncbi:MAG: PEP-CTERM sorting domain-containing protein [Desulfobacterales bacterium]|nr:PEP-CTERM sorting domain-containing protein [Desulfobacterales bacterium]